LPGDTGHRRRIVESLQQIENQLFAVAAANEINLRHLELEQLSVQCGEYAAKSNFNVRIGGANLTGENLGIGVARGGKKAQANEVGLFATNVLQYNFIGRLRVGLIEHEALVAGALEHRGKRHDADGWKSHHLDAAVFCAHLRGNCVELGIADMHQEYFHGRPLPLNPISYVMTPPVAS
jgi:hypothetical protein